MRPSRNQVVQLFRTLRNDTRLALLFTLAKHPATAAELSAAIGRPRSTVNRQLRVLTDLGFVRGAARSRPPLYKTTPGIAFLRKGGRTYLSFQVPSGERVMVSVPTIFL